MIEVDDLAEVVRPVWPAIRPVDLGPARWRLAARQHGSDGSEEVAPVKAGRKTLRRPCDLPVPHRFGAAGNELEEAIAGTDVPARVGFDDDGGAPPANTGIDNAEKDGADRNPDRHRARAGRPRPSGCRPARQRRGR